MKTLLILAALSLVAEFSSADATYAGVKVPEKIVFQKNVLKLNGVAIRKVSLFKVMVWVSALYTETAMTDAEKIINSKSIRIIDLYALYDVSAADSVKGWKLAFDSNCETKCQILESEIQRFYKTVPDFKKNSIYRYVFNPTGVLILLNDSEIFATQDPEFSSLLLKTWIGKNPPSEQIKVELIKGPAEP